MAQIAAFEIIMTIMSNALGATEKSVVHRRTTMAKKTVKVGRCAKTGRFIPVKVAKRRKATAVVETIKR